MSRSGELILIRIAGGYTVKRKINNSAGNARHLILITFPTVLLIIRSGSITKLSITVSSLLLFFVVAL